MRSYKIAIVERGKEALWRSYWIDNGSEGTQEEAPSALGRIQVVVAPTVEEAIEAVRREYPDCTVMLAGGEHSVT